MYTQLENAPISELTLNGYRSAWIGTSPEPVTDQSPIQLKSALSFVSSNATTGSTAHRRHKAVILLCRGLLCNMSSKTICKFNLAMCSYRYTIQNAPILVLTLDRCRSEWIRSAPV